MPTCVANASLDIAAIWVGPKQSVKYYKQKLMFPKKEEILTKIYKYRIPWFPAL
jgi:hypothetical protein